MKATAVIPTKRKRINFQVKAKAGSKVFVAGTFNNWDPRQNPLRDNPTGGVFKSAMLLPPGRHEYKFVVNGEWRVDPGCRECVTNAHGTLNSVVVV